MVLTSHSLLGGLSHLRIIVHNGELDREAPLDIEIAGNATCVVAGVGLVLLPGGVDHELEGARVGID